MQKKYTINSLWFEFIKTENPNTIHQVLQNNHNLLNTPDKNGTTALMLASRFNKSSKLVEILLKAGAKINKKDKFGNTALILAARDNINEKIVDLLLKFGARVDLRDNYGFSALMNAAEYCSNLKIIDLLIKADCDPHFKSQFGFNAFKLAETHNRNFKIVKILKFYTKNFCYKNTRKHLMYFFFRKRNKMFFKKIFKNLEKAETFYHFRCKLTFLHAHYLFFKNDDVDFILDIVDRKSRCVFGWDYLKYKNWKNKDKMNKYWQIFHK